MRCKLCIECIYHIYKTVPTSELGYWLRHLASGLRPSQSDSVESDRKLTLNLFETYFRCMPHAYQMYVKCLARVLLGTLKVQKPLKNQWFFNDFINECLGRVRAMSDGRRVQEVGGRGGSP